MPLEGLKQAFRQHAARLRMRSLWFGLRHRFRCRKPNAVDMETWSAAPQGHVRTLLWIIE